MMPNNTTPAPIPTSANSQVVPNLSDDSSSLNPELRDDNLEAALQQDAVVEVGTPLADSIIIDPEKVIAALRQVYDPELPVNIYDLGLIYNIDCQAQGKVIIHLTLTTPNCPVAASLPRQVAETIVAQAQTGVVSVILTWDPPWNYSRMTDEARAALNFF